MILDTSSAPYKQIWSKNNLTQLRLSDPPVWDLYMNTSGVVEVRHPITGFLICHIGQKMWCNIGGPNDSKEVQKQKRDVARELFGAYYWDPEIDPDRFTEHEMVEHGEAHFRALTMSTIKGMVDIGMNKYVMKLQKSGRRIITAPASTTPEQFQELKDKNPGKFIYVLPPRPIAKCLSSVDYYCPCGQPIDKDHSYGLEVWGIANYQKGIKAVILGDVRLKGVREGRAITVTGTKGRKVSKTVSSHTVEATPRMIISMRADGHPDAHLFKDWYLKKMNNVRFCSEFCAKRNRKKASKMRTKREVNGHGDCLHFKGFGNITEAVGTLNKACELRGVVDTFWERVLPQVVEFEQNEGVQSYGGYLTQSEHTFSPERDHCPPNEEVKYRQPGVYDLQSAGFKTKRRLVGYKDRFTQTWEEYQEWEEPSDWISEVISRKTDWLADEQFDERTHKWLEGVKGFDMRMMSILDTQDELWLNENEYEERPAATHVEQGCVKKVDARLRQLMRSIECPGCIGYLPRSQINRAQLLNGDIFRLTHGYVPLVVEGYQQMWKIRLHMD